MPMGGVRHGGDGIEGENSGEMAGIWGYLVGNSVKTECSGNFLKYMSVRTLTKRQYGA